MTKLTSVFVHKGCYTTNQYCRCFENNLEPRYLKIPRWFGFASQQYSKNLALRVISKIEFFVWSGSLAKRLGTPSKPSVAQTVGFSFPTDDVRPKKD